MVLTVDKNVVPKIPKSLQEFLHNYPSLVNEAKQFASQTVVMVESYFSLYVGQQEYAVLPSTDNRIKVAGSDDATTCHIVILKSSKGTVAVAHFDGSVKERTVNNIIRDIRSVDAEIELDVYVVGGYRSSGIEEESKNESEELSLKILKLLSEAHISFNLALWCTVELNTKVINGKSFPIFYGMAINRETGLVFPASFPTPVPGHILRSSVHWVSGSGGESNLYNYEDRSLSIPPPGDWYQDNFKFYATLPDNILLKYFSTSPFVEPATFCPRLRKVFYLLGNYSCEDLFPENVPKVYQINSNGEWNEI